MEIKLTKEEIDYILKNIRVDVDNYIENVDECYRGDKSLQELKIIPETIWKKGIIGEECGADKVLLEKLFKKLSLSTQALKEKK